MHAALKTAPTRCSWSVSIRFADAASAARPSTFAFSFGTISFTLTRKAMFRVNCTRVRSKALVLARKIPAKRVAAFACLAFVCALDTYAQSKGAGGFTKATTEISSYETPVSNLMKAIAAVIVLVGAFNVYFKMQNGDQDVKKTIMLTIGGCVAFIAMSEALPMFFK